MSDAQGVREDARLADYETRIKSVLARSDLRREAGRTKPPAGRFMREDTGVWEPLEHSGYTIITPPFEDEGESGNVKTYARLGDVQQFILENLGLAHYAPAPITSLHLTVADLVAGGRYKEQVAGACEEQLRAELSSCFAEFERQGTIQMHVVGVSVFPAGFVIALLSFREETGYRQLMSFRDSIYEHAGLKGLGVQRKFKFAGHVTLAYAESELGASGRYRLARTLIDVKERYFARPLPFDVAQAQVVKFDHLSRFYREQDWPVLQFTSPQVDQKEPR